MICRICVKECDKDILNIFDEDGEQLGIVKIIERHFWFAPLRSDMSTVICRVCWQKISDFHEFYIWVQEVQENWSTRGLVETKTVLPFEETLKINLVQEFVDIVKDNLSTDFTLLDSEETLDIKEEPEIYRNVDGMQDNSPMAVECIESPTPFKGTRNCKTNKTKSRGFAARNRISSTENDIINKNIRMECALCNFVGIDYQQITAHFKAQHIEDKPYVTCCGRKFFHRYLLLQHAKKHENPEYFKCRRCRKVFTELKNLRRHMIKFHDQKKFCERRLRSGKSRLETDGTTEVDTDLEGAVESAACDKTETGAQNIQISSNLLEDEVIIKHIRMVCDLCIFIGSDFPHLISHFKSQHQNVKPYVVCCGRKFYQRYLLLQHANKHENPEYFKCTDCQKAFSDKTNLRKHIIKCHSAVEELTHSCDQCSQRFARPYLLELHKSSHVPANERKFVCSQCPSSQIKTFASSTLLRSHIRSCHKAVNVCHVCAKEIRGNRNFEKHVRFHFEKDKLRVKCPRPDCDCWLKDEDSLKQHLRRHNDEGIIYKCDECGKVCKNRSCLTQHMKYTHTNEKFECVECHKSFKKALTLKEHMAHHTGEPLYQCPFCTRTFNFFASMHSHKKKMHPLEYEAYRKSKRCNLDSVDVEKPPSAEK